MKKSSFLQSSKDMLSRSFNPAKCKTSLRLAGSRLKLLKNKKEVQVKQMKREISQLLESGQDQTARIRVEHVIREEKMMAAYDLLEIYCELIVARLPIIESQKNCPIDLKEAIASVIFASPRCGDVPELLDIRKQFTAKYGKEFATAAIELRPMCGASRMLVEKLSATAPDVQTKNKILSAIAEEYNVKWDTKPVEEENSVPPSDLLSGPSNLGKESKQYVEPPPFEASPAQAPPSNTQMHSSPLNLSHQSPTTSLEAEKLVSAQNSDVRAKFQPEARPPALGDERAQLFQEDINSSPRWNMEFKDAASAAQAAADSAQRASMAARAAVELSNRERHTRQHSTESHNSDAYNLQDDSPEKTHPSSQFSEESVNRSSPEQIDEIKETDEKADIMREERVGKQPSISSYRSHSHSHSSSISDDLNIYSNPEDKNFENISGENPFAGIDKGSIHGETTHTSSQEPAAVFFDKYDSESDSHHQFDMGPTYDDGSVSEFDMPSFSEKPPQHSSSNTDSWNPKSGSSKIVKSTSPSPFFAGENSSHDFPDNNPTSIDSSAPLRFDDSESEDEMNNKIGQYDESPFKESHMELNDVGDESSEESGQRLNFEKLTGGIRHKKGYKYPSFLKNRSDKSQSVEKKTEKTEISTRKAQDSDSSEEETYIKKNPAVEVKTKSSLGASNSSFGSDSSDLDENPPKETPAIKNHHSTGISRRTKGFHSQTSRKSESQMRNSTKLGNYEEPTSAEVDCPCTNDSSSWETQEKPDLVKATKYSITQDSKISGKSSSVEDDSSKKASHVHPKLPDYDTLFQSFQKGRS